MRYAQGAITPLGVPRVFTIRRALRRSGGFEPQRRPCHEDVYGDLLEEGFPDAWRRMGGHAGNRTA